MSKNKVTLKSLQEFKVTYYPGKTREMFQERKRPDEEGVTLAQESLKKAAEILKQKGINSP
jgi:hypothetical protein